MGAETRPAGFYGDVEQFLLFPEDLEAVHALEGMAAVRFEHLAQDGVPSPLWVVNKVGRVQREARTYVQRKRLSRNLFVNFNHVQARAPRSIFYKFENYEKNKIKVKYNDWKRETNKAFFTFSVSC